MRPTMPLGTQGTKSSTPGASLTCMPTRASTSLPTMMGVSAMGVMMGVSTKFVGPGYGYGSWNVEGKKKR
jgi:hypothetical protein